LITEIVQLILVCSVLWYMRKNKEWKVIKLRISWMNCCYSFLAKKTKKEK
jgi:hypothetical protein